MSSILLGAIALLWLSAQQMQAKAEEFNITVDDTDPSIIYMPSTAWNTISSPCSTCTNLGLSVQSFHNGSNILPTSDKDDKVDTDKDDTDKDDADKDESDEDNDSNDAVTEQSNSRKGKGKNRRNVIHRLDDDDPTFVDTPVTAEFKFNGSAVYLFCVQTPTSPNAINLSFILDNEHFPSYFNNSPALSVESDINVFAQENLDNTPHVLVVSLGINSVFMFDYMLYTQETSVIASDTSPSSSVFPISTTVLSPTSSASANSKHNVATFAGAIGGSVGVLGCLALGIFISIYRRRLRSARRARLERGDRPTMIGPQPFMPRYFPGTVPTVPPPYVSSSGSTSTLSFHITPTVPTDVEEQNTDQSDPVPTYTGPAPGYMDSERLIIAESESTGDAEPRMSAESSDNVDETARLNTTIGS